jgi:outer membrane protein TolC
MWMTDREGWMVGAGWDVPLFWRARRASVDRAQAASDRAAAEVVATTTGVDADVAMARTEVDRAEAVLALRRDRLVPLARERLETARIELSSGEAEFADVLRAERDLLDAEAELVDAESARRSALLRWRHAAGAPLEAP